MDRKSQPANLKRLRAACALLGLTVDELARRCGVSAAHVRFVALGERKASARLIETLRVQLGSTWAFVAGEADTLAVPRSDPGTGE